MKILAITARYPPYHFGGYEIRCKNIVDELSHRCYEILVITSKKERGSRISDPATKYHVLRGLTVRTARAKSLIDQFARSRRGHIVGMLLTFVREFILDLCDLQFVDRQIKQFQPSVIYLGHINPLSRSLMPYLAACSIPIVYDEGGSGLIDSWVERGIWYKFVDEYVSHYRIINAIKKLIVKLACKVSANRIKPQWTWPSKINVFFNSELNLRNASAIGVPVNRAGVIHSGVDIKKFSYRSKALLSASLTCLVPGRIEPRKGQIDAVRLLAKLQEQGINARMIIVGENWANSYCLEIEKVSLELGIQDCVSLIQMVSQNQLVHLYHQADVCFFPSYQKVGYSRTPLEAMACGCIVVSYGNEGSDEIIQDKYTGFLVPPADYGVIADVIKELIANPAMFRDILYAARRKVEDDCALQTYVDQIEEFVEKAVSTC